MSICTTRRGGAIPEILAGAAALALLAALVLPGAAGLRAESRTASSVSQLRWLATATGSYAADNAELFWAFSWTKDNLPHSDPTLPTRAASDRIATAVQAVHILRRRAYPEMPTVPAWIPQMLYHICRWWTISMLICPIST